MAYGSVNDLTFSSTVQQWIEANGEVLALIRFHASAGAKSFEFFRSMDDFKIRLADLPPRTCVIVFRDHQLPLRGRVDEEFIRKASALVPNGVEFLVVVLERISMGAASWFHDAAGQTHDELIEELRDSYCYGKSVAVGPYPPWLEDTAAVISAVVPNSDGSVTVGIY
ncbi:MAG TPA: hypothetical protein VGP72_33010 [Planctomycetota bacterium]|jgi:hypothetical protein